MKKFNPLTIYFSLYLVNLLIFLIAVLYCLSGCSTAGREYSVNITDESVVTIGDEKSETIQANHKISSKLKPILIEKKGHASVYIIPVEGDDKAEVTVKLREMKDWSSDDLSIPLNKMLQDIIEIHIEAQMLMAKGDYAEALVKIEALKSSYPNATFINFVHASCLVLLGELGKAKGLLEIALKDYPENINGKELLKVLSENPKLNQ